MSVYRLLAFSTVVLLDLYMLYHNSIKTTRKLKLLHQILELIPTRPSEIIDKLKTLTNSPTLQICKGKVFAGQPCTALMDSNFKIVYSKLIHTIIGPRFSQKLLRVKQPSFLKISDEMHNINVFETHNTVIIPTKMLSLRPKSTFNLIGLFYKIKQPLVSYVGYSSFGGENLRQLILPQGSECTILGKFVAQSSGVSCYQPILVAPSKDRMIAVIQQDLISKKLINILLTIGAGFAIVIILKQIWKLIQKYKTRSHDFIQKVNKIFLKSRICAFCKKNMSCILSKECNHMNVCRDCQIKQGDDCLQCKKKLEEIVQFFVC